MITILLILQLLPAQESFTYETNDKGKVGTMDVDVQKDSLGYHVIYTWENRILELIFDTLDMSTIYVKKMVGDKIELEIKREQKLNVFFKGRRFSYKQCSGRGGYKFSTRRYRMLEGRDGSKNTIYKMAFLFLD
jgi:hypothetical protein